MKEIIEQIWITSRFVFSCFVAMKIAVFVEIFVPINVSAEVLGPASVLFITSWVILNLSWPV